MQVIPLYTGSSLRNFTYLVVTSEKNAYCIDPWEADFVAQCLEKHGLGLIGIINTHEHWDHIQGNEELVKRYNCPIFAHKNAAGSIPGLSKGLQEGDRLDLGEGNCLEIMDTPGHTMTHVCLKLLEKDKVLAVFTGDTLFNAGVGHCRLGGDPEVLYQTIRQRFFELPDEVVVYPGHEYFVNNLKFTLKHEPGNNMAKEWLEKTSTIDWGAEHMASSLGDEKEINTFFRLDNSEIRSQLGLENGNEKQVFLKLREYRNNW